MGKKAKIGKRRKDKFYHLAKETGYRARSAFKLIQLNRKFQFLDNARVCIDLCAAPGGWCQVAVRHMPMSSLVIGVDLVPIKPMHKNVITMQEDITTEKCRQSLRRELKTWKADVVLNDGAPNVGAAWVQDAFSQSELALAALKLACEFLMPGGAFVTKVFRSKDYQALITVFHHFFKKVNATKPQASRLESAEIFVVCQGYRSPSKIDPKLLDPKHVFQEVQLDPPKPSIFKVDKRVAAEGYEEGLSAVYREAKLSEFITSSQYLDILNTANKFVFDSRLLEQHPLTTSDVKQHCEDIKVLGRRELRTLLKWRESMRKVLEQTEAKGDEEEATAMEVDVKEDDDEDHDTDVEEAMASLKAAERAKAKREHRKMMKQKKKLNEEINLKMKLPGDTPAIREEASLFSLRSLSSGQFIGEQEIDGDTEEDTDEELVSEQETEEDMEDTDEESEEKGIEIKSLDAEGFAPSRDVTEDEPDKRPKDEKKGVKRKSLDMEGLALGSLISQSKKSREMIEDEAYNRYTFNDPPLPSWFVEDEARHFQRRMPITKDMVAEYKQRLKEINARPMKKIAEAKARKRRKAVKKMEGARKQAQRISDSNLSEAEKNQQLRSVQRKLNAAPKKKSVQYVVAKKCQAAKRMRRPAGVKGHYKVVDPRMKKEVRAKHSREKKKPSRGKKR